MVNDAVTFGIDPAGGHPERALALSYAAPAVRPAIEALFALDRTLARLTLGTRDPVVAQLRLAWWGEALRGEAQGAERQPILRTLAASGVDTAALATIVDGWERLLLDAPDLPGFAHDRGILFAAAAVVAGARDDVTAAGQGWALADLAASSGDARVAGQAADAAAPLLSRAAAQRWTPAGRFLGALAHVARADLAGRQPPGSARRVVRLAWLRMSGR